MNSNSSSPFFSVVIPTYNRAHLIVDTINSVIKQSYADYEIIIVDDGSTDNTEDIVNGLQYPHLHYFKRPNLERGAARNFGISQSIGKYVTFCDSDDLLFPNYLANAYETITKNNNADWIHVAYEIKKIGKPGLKMHHFENNFIIKMAKGNPLSCMGVFVKRSLLEENKFQENRNMAGSEDWELWLRLASRYQIFFDNRISASLLVHDERSVVQTNELKLQLRKYLSIGYAFEDDYVKQCFGNYRKMMNAYFDTYIALHLVLGKKKGAIKYFLKAFYRYPFVIFNRRALAIFKHLVLRVFNR